MSRSAPKLALISLSIVFQSVLCHSFTPRNILLLTIDSLRADMLGAHGCPDHTTPFLDQLSKRSTVFSQAISPSSWTSPSIISILTGLDPEVHGVIDSQHALSPYLQSLPQIAMRAKYQVPALSYLLAIPNYRNLHFDAGSITDDTNEPGMGLKRWAQTAPSQPFFAYYHFHGPHLPYRADFLTVSMFCHLDVALLNTPRFQALQERAIILANEFKWFPEDQAMVKTLYMAKLREFDTIFERLIYELAELGILNQTLVIVTADHGELLLEHGQIGHPSTNFNCPPYDELIHVPLLVFNPAASNSSIIDTQVQTLDIPATACELVGLAWPTNYQSRSLVPLMLGATNRYSRPVAFSSATNCGYQCFEDSQITTYRTAKSSQYLVISGSAQTPIRAFWLRDELSPTQLTRDQHRFINKLVTKLERHRCISARLAHELTSGNGPTRFAEPIPTSLQLFYRGRYFQIQSNFTKARQYYLAAKEKFHSEGYPLSTIQLSDDFITGILDDLEVTDSD